MFHQLQNSAHHCSQKAMHHSNKYEALDKCLSPINALTRFLHSVQTSSNRKMPSINPSPSGQTYVTTVSGQHDQHAIEGEDINESNMADIEAVEGQCWCWNVSVGRWSGMQFLMLSCQFSQFY